MSAQRSTSYRGARPAHHCAFRYKGPESDYGWITSKAHVGMFLDACKTPWFRMACELAVYAGLRVGEVAGLHWDRVDFDRNLIRVDRSYDGPTKNKHIRTVPLAPELAEKLKRWRLATGAMSKGFVVAIDGEPLTPEQGDFAKRTRRACKRAKVEPEPFSATPIQRRQPVTPTWTRLRLHGIRACT